MLSWEQSDQNPAGGVSHTGSRTAMEGGGASTLNHDPGHRQS